MTIALILNLSPLIVRHEERALGVVWESRALSEVTEFVPLGKKGTFINILAAVGLGSTHI